MERAVGRGVRAVVPLCTRRGQVGHWHRSAVLVLDATGDLYARWTRARRSEVDLEVVAASGDANGASGRSTSSKRETGSRTQGIQRETAFSGKGRPTRLRGGRTGNIQWPRSVVHRRGAAGCGQPGPVSFRALSIPTSRLVLLGGGLRAALGNWLLSMAAAEPAGREKNRLSRKSSWNASIRGRTTSRILLGVGDAERARIAH